MQDNKLKIEKYRITDMTINISPDIDDEIELSVTCKANLRISNEPEDSNVLLNIELKVHSPNDDMVAEMSSDFIFEMKETLDDYSDIAEKQMIPMAAKELLEKLDEILPMMGYSKIGFVDRIDD